VKGNGEKGFQKMRRTRRRNAKQRLQASISQTEVERLIKIGIGADKRTVQKYMKMLTEDLGFLKTQQRIPLEQLFTV